MANVNLNISRFNTADYPTLNNPAGQMDVCRWEVAKAFIDIGYDNTVTAHISQSFYRVVELYAKAHAYLQISSNNLVLSANVNNLDASESRSISYFIGQSLSKIFAEKKLDCLWVDNIDKHKGNSITLNRLGTRVTPKIAGTPIPKNAKSPDLIGIDANNGFHILESKCGGAGYESSALSKAIFQVSQVSSVNRSTPKTLTACFFNISTNPIRGTIIDPEPEEGTEISIELDDNKFITKHYSFFINLIKRHSEFGRPIKRMSLEGERFYFIQIGYPYTFYGIRETVLKYILHNENYSIEELSSILKSYNDISLNNEFVDKANFFLGKDGITLFRGNSKTYWRSSTINPNSI